MTVKSQNEHHPDAPFFEMGVVDDQNPYGSPVQKPA